MAKGMTDYYDRYKMFRKDGKILKIPKIDIEVSTSDLFVVYQKDKMRFDNLSYKYFGDANFGWLILMANPHLGSLEFEIPDKSLLRIPYPLDSAILRYETKVNEYFGK